jgi:hypothetical protein
MLQIARYSQQQQQQQDMACIASFSLKKSNKTK